MKSNVRRPRERPEDGIWISDLWSFYSCIAVVMYDGLSDLRGFLSFLVVRSHTRNSPKDFYLLAFIGCVGVSLVPPTSNEKILMSQNIFLSSRVEADIMQIIALHGLLDFALSECLAGNDADNTVLEGAVVLTRDLRRKFRHLANAFLSRDAVKRD